MTFWWRLAVVKRDQWSIERSEIRCSGRGVQNQSYRDVRRASACGRHWHGWGAIENACNSTSADHYSHLAQRIIDDRPSDDIEQGSTAASLPSAVENIRRNSAAYCSGHTDRRNTLRYSAARTRCGIAGSRDVAAGLADVGEQTRAGRLRVQHDSANATASAPAAKRTGHDGSFAARHTASATSSARVTADDCCLPAKTLCAKPA